MEFPKKDILAEGTLTGANWSQKVEVSGAMSRPRLVAVRQQALPRRDAAGAYCDDSTGGQKKPHDVR